jgi:hypothetical protein
MKVKRIQRKAVFTMAVLSVLSVGTCFAQEVQPVTKEDIRTGFKAGIEKVRSNYVECLKKLSLTPEDVDAMEKASSTGEITDPEVLLCLETRKTERSALIDQYKALRETLREQAQAKREKAAADRKQAVEERKAAAQEKKGSADEKKAAAEERKTAVKEK